MRIRLTSVLLAVLLILSLVFLPACAPTAASSAEPTETALPADLPVMTRIWITPECYQAHPENAVYNAQGDRLCTDGATMEVLEAEGPDINGIHRKNGKILQFHGNHGNTALPCPASAHPGKRD